MRPFLVVPRDPLPNDPTRLLKGLERVLSDALLFQTPEELFDQPILTLASCRDGSTEQTTSLTLP